MPFTAQELVKRTMTVASLPSLYQKVDQAINRQANNQLIQDLIAEDSAMTARLLKLVNSAMFSFPQKINSVSQAIAIIGTQQLRALILASSVMSMFKDVPEELINMESFWRHSVACAAAARIIASLRREANIEYYFLAGLLHDIGRLILFKEKPDLMKQAIEDAQEEHSTLFLKEREIIGFDHAKLGALLLKEWKLSALFVEATQYHHNPNAAVNYPEIVATVHVADIITNALQYGHSGEIYVPAVNEKAWNRINIKVELVDSLIVELDRQYNVAVEFVLGGADENKKVA